MRISDWSSDVCSSDLRKRSKDGKEVAIDPMRQIKQLTTVDFSLSYVSKSVVPDPEYAYAIRYDESAWSSDKLTVDVSSMGLMDKVHLKAEDTTDTIVLKVEELAKEAAKAIVSFGEVAAEAKEAGDLQPGEECIQGGYESVTRVDSPERV